MDREAWKREAWKREAWKREAWKREAMGYCLAAIKIEGRKIPGG